MNIDHNDDNDLMPEEQEESFAELFEQSAKAEVRLAPGQKVEAKVLKIASDWVFLDIGRKGEGVLEKKELLDAEGNLSVQEGDTIDAYFLSAKQNEFRFTTRVSSGTAGLAILEDAYRSGIPVEGVVEKEVKGGFEVRVGGKVRSFCPFSQASLRRLESNEGFIGKQLLFRITGFTEQGRNIVVSRRSVLEEEQQEQKNALKETLKEGMTVKGTVTSLRDFGAFVNIGSVDGLLPISEIGWKRVKDVSEVLSVGQEVEVVVKQIDWDKDRISFSLKDTLADPWQNVGEKYREGSYHTGRISRLAQFGAFVTLEDGVDGLIHISKLGGGKRINNPREAVNEGDLLEVKIEKVEPESRRISLSLAGVARAEEEEEAAIKDFRQGATSETASMGSLGDLLKARFEDKKQK